MTTALFTRPFQWAGYKSELKLVHAPLSPGEETLLRNGKPCWDSVGGVMTESGAENLLREFRRHKPDVFLWWAHYMQDGSKDRLRKLCSVLKQARRISPKTMFLYGNGNQQGFPDFNIEAFNGACGVDGVLVNTRDEREVRMYKSHGIKVAGTLHTFGFDPAEHGSAVSPGPPKYDCFFGGSQTADLKTGRPVKFYPKNPMMGGKYANSKMRLDFIKEVDKRFKLLIRGKGKWPVKNLQPYAHGRDYPKALRSAKIVLGMYHWDLERYYTKRTIYSGASGRLLITYYIPRMEEDFRNHENIVWFNSVEEGLELIDGYLKDERARERIAERQRANFVMNHSWAARLREFENIVGSL